MKPPVSVFFVSLLVLIYLPLGAMEPTARELQVEKALAEGRPDRALGPLLALYRESTGDEDRLRWVMALSELYYREGLWADGLEFHLAWHRLDPGSRGTLRLAEYFAYHEKSQEKASEYTLRLKVSPQWPQRDRETASLLRRTVLFSRWDLKPWGLTDGNISAMLQDQDDLWIGTWNGGLARFSLATREVTTFRSGEYTQNLTTIRCLAVDSRFVYVGGFEGIRRYSKLTGTWSVIPAPEGFPLERIQDMVIQDRKLLVATLGAGIWEWSGSAWKNWKDYGWKADYVNKIVPQGDSFLVATMDQGAWEFRPGREPLSLLQGFPGKLPKNITFLVNTGEDLWLGTYGQGLLRYRRSSDTWDLWNSETGNLQGDYLIAGTVTPGGVIFGTLGLGLAYYSRSLEKLVLWRPGISGAPADVGAVSVLGSRVLLGTLGEGLMMAEEAILETELP